MRDILNTLLVTLEVWGGLFCILAAVYLGFGKSIKEKKSRRLSRILLCNGGVSVLVLMRYLVGQVDGSHTALFSDLIFMLIVLLVYGVFYQMAMMIDEELVQITEKETETVLYDRFWIRLCKGLTVFAVVMVCSVFLLRIFFGLEMGYLMETGTGYYIIMIFGVLCAMILVVELLSEMKRLSLEELMGDLLISFMPILGIVIEFSTGGRYIAAILMNFGSLVLVAVHSFQKDKMAYENKLQLEEQKRELAEMKNQIMLSQIQPHFLYNCLATIQYLCKKDPKMATEAVKRFSLYLRNNLGSIGKEDIIPFAKELDHVKTYLWLEQLRYGDELKIEYDIACTDFSLPALTIQPLAENAIRHGIMLKHMGGTLKISSKKEDNYFVVLVEDDGQGFETEMLDDTNNAYQGIANIRNRIKKMCDGDLVVISQPEKGTRVIIAIPFDQEQKEGDEEA